MLPFPWDFLIFFLIIIIMVAFLFCVFFFPSTPHVSDLQRRKTNRAERSCVLLFVSLSDGNMHVLFLHDKSVAQENNRQINPKCRQNGF